MKYKFLTIILWFIFLLITFFNCYVLNDMEFYLSLLFALISTGIIVFLIIKWFRQYDYIRKKNRQKRRIS